MSSTTVVAKTATCRAWCFACNRWAFDQWSVVMRGFGGAAGGVVGVAGSFCGALAGDRTGVGRGFGDATAGSFGARGGGGAGLGLRSPRHFGVAAAGGVGGDALAGFAAFRGERFFRFFAARNFLKSLDVASSGEAAGGDLARFGAAAATGVGGFGV